MKDNNNSHAPWTVLYMAAALLLVTSLVAYIGLVSTAEILYPLAITDAWTADPEGNPKFTFALGDPVKIFAEITTTEYMGKRDLSFIAVIMVIDPQETPIFISLFQGIISPGEVITISTGFKIPEDALTGNYTVRIMIWSDWPSKTTGTEWKALAEPYEFTFEVVEESS